MYFALRLSDLTYTGAFWREVWANPRGCRQGMSIVMRSEEPSEGGGWRCLTVEDAEHRSAAENMTASLSERPHYCGNAAQVFHDQCRPAPSVGEKALPRFWLQNFDLNVQNKTYH